MYAPETRPRKYRRERPRSATPNIVIKMDPDCAICSAPAVTGCECESKLLETAVKEAEQRVMKPYYHKIREWVRAKAQDRIIQHFRELSERRRQAHAAQLKRIHSYAQYHYNAPPHPNDIANAQAELKRAIDEDWRASVELYPEVLEYFFGLVSVNLPSNEDPALNGPELPPTPPSKAHRRRQINSAPPPPQQTHAPPQLLEQRYAEPQYAMEPAFANPPPPRPAHEPMLNIEPNYAQHGVYAPPLDSRASAPLQRRRSRRKLDGYYKYALPPQFS